MYRWLGGQAVTLKSRQQHLFDVRPAVGAARTEEDMGRLWRGRQIFNRFGLNASQGKDQPDNQANRKDGPQQCPPAGASHNTA